MHARRGGTTAARASTLCAAVAVRTQNRGKFTSGTTRANAYQCAWR
jgi:hypothetical protein